MFKKIKNKITIYLLNFLGILCLLLVPIIQPLPGPGGLPLTLLGLHLLSINNPWAQRLKKSIQTHGLNLGDFVFPNDKRCQLVWDIVIYLGILACLSPFLLIDTNYWQQIILSVILSVLGTGWLQNRRRWQTFVKFLNSKNKTDS